MVYYLNGKYVPGVGGTSTAAPAIAAFIASLNINYFFNPILYKLPIVCFNDINLKSHIIEITSIFELRKSQGTRHIECFEAYLIRLIYLFSNYFKGNDYQYNLDILEL